MALDNLAARTVKLANIIRYSGNLRGRHLQDCKKLGLSKNALSLPPEMRAYQVFLNVVPLYVAEERGKIRFRGDIPASNHSPYDVQIMMDRFVQAYMNLEAKETDEDIIGRMQEGYKRVKRTITETFPESKIGLKERMDYLENAGKKEDTQNSQ